MSHKPNLMHPLNQGLVHYSIDSEVNLVGQNGATGQLGDVKSGPRGFARIFSGNSNTFINQKFAPTGDFTVLAYVNLSGDADSVVIGTLDQSTAQGWALGYKFGLGYCLYLGNTVDLADGINPINVSGWHVVGFVYKAVSQTVLAYVDGILVDTYVNTETLDLDSTYEVTIGDQPQSGLPFDGQIGWTAILKRSLSSSEMRLWSDQDRQLFVQDDSPLVKIDSFSVEVTDSISFVENVIRSRSVLSTRSDTVTPYDYVSGRYFNVSADDTITLTENTTTNRLRTVRASDLVVLTESFARRGTFTRYGGDYLVVTDAIVAPKVFNGCNQKENKTVQIGGPRAIILLPKPQLDDSEQLNHELVSIRSESGANTIRLLKRRSVRDLTWSFRLQRNKAQLLKDFCDLEIGNELTIRDWRNNVYRGWLDSNPIVFVGTGKWNDGEEETITLVFKVRRSA